MDELYRRLAFAEIDGAAKGTKGLATTEVLDNEALEPGIKA